MKKIIILFFVLFSLFSCEKKLKNGQILYDQKTLMLSEYKVIIDECYYGKLDGYYYFQAWFTESLSGERMYFEFSILDRIGLTEIFDEGLYKLEANITVSMTTGNIFAYPIIKYSKKGNNYQKIDIIGE